jgi:hypothetical protein
MLIGGMDTIQSVELFNYQSGQVCRIEPLPLVIDTAVGGIFDGYPAICGGRSSEYPVSILL